MEEVVYQKHMENAEKSQIGELWVDGSWAREIGGDGNTVFKGFDQEGGGGEIEVGIGEGELIIILCVSAWEEDKCGWFDYYW